MKFWVFHTENLHFPIQTANDFRREAPENGAEGAVSDNFTDFSENFFLKNEIKSESLVVLGWKFFPEKRFRKVLPESVPERVFRQNYVLNLQ